MNPNIDNENTKRGTYNTAGLIALWAFSESTLGGLLHLFKIPLSGVILGGAAVVFLSLIAYSSGRKAIIKATVIALIIKGIVSPHTPFMAYFSVGLQGAVAYLLFYPGKGYKFKALILGASTISFFAVQKFLVMTLIYGAALWESIDKMGSGALKEFGISGGIQDASLSLVLFSVYFMLHLAGGIFFGLLAGKLPEKLNGMNITMIPEEVKENPFYRPKQKKGSGKKKWLNRALRYFLPIVILAGGYLFALGIKGADLGIIFLRSVIIILFWYFIISPLLLKNIKKWLGKRQSRYYNEVNDILLMFPGIREAAGRSWAYSSKKKGMGRIGSFLAALTFLYVSGDYTPDN